MNRVEKVLFAVMLAICISSVLCWLNYKHEQAEKRNNVALLSYRVDNLAVLIDSLFKLQQPAPVKARGR